MESWALDAGPAIMGPHHGSSVKVNKEKGHERESSA
jgi:hypothetical protein